ncbi:MAG: hypothetical protein J6D06_11595 [Clostridia bacterium]|nr:hypothetical protein [Clostridia bacterium]MBO5066751.1 hypothetical protein [Clostridia bacterium]
MAKFGLDRLIFIAVSIVVIALIITFGEKNNKNESETTTSVSATIVTTTAPVSSTTEALTETEPSTGETDTTEPVETAPVERRTPNVHFFVPESPRVDESYFDDVVFVGDSVSLRLTYYNMANECFGDAVFLTSGSLGVTNSQWGLYEPKAVHPSYQGQKVTVADGIQKCGKKKVYIMLGINDMAYYTRPDLFAQFKSLTDSILEKSPDVTFYIQSVTPMTGNKNGTTNDEINEYNALISQYCCQKGWYFVDVASVLRDENGLLPRKYCSDPDGMGIHFTDAACEVWKEYLYTHVPAEALETTAPSTTAQTTKAATTTKSTTKNS